ncbi:hypothetical protein NIES2104_08780 [Leptolyngbya sp. NIES-2104]|nr:hypothetical protein NIES2104_08780 [Leptolyngbya sp. NIES-2104]
MKDWRTVAELLMGQQPQKKVRSLLQDSGWLLRSYSLD